MAQTSLSRLFSTFTSSSPSSSVSSTIHSNEEEGNDISTERDNFHGRSRILTAVAAEPLGSAAVVTPCRPPNPEKMASSSTTVATAAITPMTPSPFASPFKSPFKLSPSPACSEDSSLEDSVSSQPCVAPTAAPVPNRRLYETGVTFRDLQQGFMGNSSSPPQHESHCRQTPQSADADVLLVESKRRNLFSSERFSETPPRTHQSGSSSSRRHQRAAETYGPTVRSRTSVPASVRKSRLQESLFLIDDPPPSRVGVRSQSANSFSRQPYPSCSYELSSHSSPESSPVSTGSTEAARNSSSSSSLRLLRRRASHASMLVLPHDDDEDSCFEDKKTSNSSRDFLLPKRGSLLVIWTFCMAAAMAAFGMIVVSKFVPFQEAQNAEPSQGLALYSPPVPQRRADLHRSASGLRGKMVQSGASRIVAEEVPPKGAVITTRTSQLNGKPSTTVTNTIVERKVQPQSKKTISTTPKTTQKATKKNRHDKEKKPSLLAKVSKSFSSTSSKASVGANTQSLLLQLAQPRSAPAFQTPERGILSVSLQGWDDLDASLYTSAGKETISLFNKHEGWSPLPRVIALGASFSGMEHRLVKQYPADFSDNTQLYSLLESNDERLSRMERKEPLSDGECVPMHEWQTTFHPLCNGMHELSIEHSLGNESEDEGNNINLFGTKGFWRNAWKLDIEHGSSKHAERDTVVLKTLKFEHNYEDDFFEHNRIDAVAMERLTSSPHVINVFGFCGHSVMTEFGDGSRVGELADKSRKNPRARLKIACDIAHGLADVHGIDGDGVASFVHLDVNPANVVSIGGTLKLNDFNIGILRRWNTTSNTPCGFPTQYPNPQWRSPEEARNELDLTEKVDIFSMGHIFFRLICGHEPWNKLEPGGRPSKEEVNEKVQRGDLPFIPEDIRNTDDPEVIAIRDAMIKCYTFDPKERPSARVIANELGAALDALEA